MFKKILLGIIICILLLSLRGCFGGVSHEKYYETRAIELIKKMHNDFREVEMDQGRGILYINEIAYVGSSINEEDYTIYISYAYTKTWFHDFNYRWAIYKDGKLKVEKMETAGEIVKKFKDLSNKISKREAKYKHFYSDEEIRKIMNILATDEIRFYFDEVNGINLKD